MFEIGDEVICIDSGFDDSVFNFGNDSDLTVGKMYIIIECYPGWSGVKIMGDRNKVITCFFNRFVKLSEYRRKKLEKICQKQRKHITTTQ